VSSPAPSLEVSLGIFSELALATSFVKHVCYFSTKNIGFCHISLGIIDKKVIATVLLHVIKRQPRGRNIVLSGIVWLERCPS
jgi:hypothetical protein